MNRWLNAGTWLLLLYLLTSIPCHGQTGAGESYLFRPSEATTNQAPMDTPPTYDSPGGFDSGPRPNFLPPSQPATPPPPYGYGTPPPLDVYQQPAANQYQVPPQGTPYRRATPYGQQPGYPPQQYRQQAPQQAPQQQPPSTITTQVELPRPQPVVDSSPLPVPVSPNTPAIIFEEEQSGLPEEVVVEPQEEIVEQPPFDPGSLLQQKKYGELRPFIIETRNSPLAAAVGWSMYNDGQYDGATRYFERAIEFNDSNLEATYGLALSLFKMGRYNQAEAVARWRIAEYPQMKDLMGDILTARAVASYEAKQYLKSRAYLEEVSNYRKLTRDEQLMQAWNYFHTNDLAQAGERFSTLYATNPDKFAAAGVYAAYAKQQDWRRIQQLSAEYGGPLAVMYRDYQSEQYYNRKLYANAYATAPKRYPDLRNIDSPYLDGRVNYRYKTGDSGLSRLQEVRGEFTTALYEDGINKFGFEMGVSYLDSGSLPAFSLVGLVPLPGTFNIPFPGFAPYLFKPTTTTGPIADFRVTYEREGFWTPFIELGISPAGGEIAPTIVGNAGVRVNADWGNWSAEVFRESVKESILSYVGIRDPYFGERFGRVTENGFRATLFRPFPYDFSFFGAMQFGYLEGHNVEQNDHVRLTLAVNREFEHPDFEYLVVGPAISYEHYDKNLSFFTYGQGGYFSPDYLLQGLIQGQFMTTEGEEYLAQGNLGFGLQTYRQAASPFFPLTGSTAVFEEDEATTFIFLANVGGLMKLNEHWALGGSAGYNRTANYGEFSANVYLKYFFLPRGGLFAFDMFEF